MSNEKPTPYVQRGLNMCRRSHSYSKASQSPMITCIRLNTRAHERRGSFLVHKSKENVSNLRMMRTVDPALKDEQYQMQLTPLKKRPNIRVIRINRLQESPDHKITTESAVYKEYTQTPLNKENDYEAHPVSLMNELLLFTKTETPRMRTTRSRIRVRPLMYAPN
mmetsp:Transcript_22764/g.40948  ORF Transcript_22764/g.40948 Transcript_22764/m.40948 type:complete len:165 (+) Transcript_22764:2443-2937(+)